jgi:hypothetical protein
VLTSFLTIAAGFVGVWAFFKYVILVEMRVDSNTFKMLYDYFKDDRKFLIHEEFTFDVRHPVQYAAIILSQKSPWFYVSHSERLMQAGWQSKDFVTVVTCCRWNYAKFKKFLSEGLKEIALVSGGVPVQVLLPYCADKIGALKNLAPEPVVDKTLWSDIEAEVAEVVAGKRRKTGALLYGAPGNGKTSLVKYLATKYRLPIMVFTLDPQFNNHDLLLMFSNIPPRCIVLMEDFDNYFNKRDCLFGGQEKSMVRFTFDVILNGLDGVFNTHEGVIFIMTVNNIDFVDPALRNRPSRFKYTKHFGNPSIEVRQKLLQDGWAERASNLNLDQIFRLHEYQKDGHSFEEAMRRLEKEITNSIEQRAASIYRKRLASGLSGTAEQDWLQAEKELTSV